MLFAALFALQLPRGDSSTPRRRCAPARPKDLGRHPGIATVSPLAETRQSRSRRRTFSHPGV